jgi:hypothetical protein
MLKKFHDPPLGGAQPAARTPGEPPFPGLWGLLQGDTPRGMSQSCPLTKCQQLTGTVPKHSPQSPSQRAN